MHYFLGGLCKYTKEFFAVYCPYINSYKRLNNWAFEANTTNTWGIDNRGTTFRLVGFEDKNLRIEVRIAGSDFNPYLGYAAAMFMGLEGIKNKIEPPPISKNVNLYDPSTKIDDDRRVPADLEKALNNLKSSKFVG